MLATLTQIKERLGMSGTQDDAALTGCLRAASLVIARWCNRTIEYAAEDLVEYFDGGGTDLLLQAFPIVSVAGIVYAPDYDYDAAVALGASEYHVNTRRGRITRLPLDNRWTPGADLWRVTYRGGYWPADATGEKPTGVLDLPGHFTEACLLEAIDWFGRKDSPGYKMVESMIGGAGSVGLAPEITLLPMVKELVCDERRLT